MAKPRTQTVVDPQEMAGEVMPDDMDLISTAPEDWEFETVAEESPTHVLFDTVGDVFIGQYQARITIEHTVPVDKDHPEGINRFDLFTFRGRDGVLYAVNTSGKLDEAMKEVDSGQWVRLTLIKFIPSKKGNDFKDFRVEVKKS